MYAVRSVEARKIADMLPDVLMNLITGISWPKTQRWGDHDELFSRPVRWLLAMLDDEMLEQLVTRSFRSSTRA